MKQTSSDSVLVKSAVSLDSTQKSELAKILKTRFGIGAPISYEINKKILAGFTVTYKQWYLDASALRDLIAMKRGMK